MKRKKSAQAFDWESLLAGIAHGNSAQKFGPDATIFRQGEPADSVVYLHQGKVKLTVTSDQGKEVNVAILCSGEILGEGCLAGQPLRIATATALIETCVTRIEKTLMVRLLHEQHSFAEGFAARLLSRNVHYEEDLIGQLFNSSEKRLARVLLLLAHYGKERRSETIRPRISQKTMAEKIGVSQSRVNYFLTKFKRLGFIDYGRKKQLAVNSGLLSVVLHDDAPPSRRITG